MSKRVCQILKSWYLVLHEWWILFITKTRSEWRTRAFWSRPQRLKYLYWKPVENWIHVRYNYNIYNINATLISNTFELCARYFYLYALPFNLVTDILRILTVIFHIEEGLYTWNVCVDTQFWLFAIIISLIINLILDRWNTGNELDGLVPSSSRSNQGPVSRTSRELFGPEKLVVKLQSARFEKLIFLHAFNMRKIKRIAKFEGLEPRRCEDIEGIVVPDIGPKSFGTFEKQALGLSRSTVSSNPRSCYRNLWVSIRLNQRFIAR